MFLSYKMKGSICLILSAWSSVGSIISDFFIQVLQRGQQHFFSVPPWGGIDDICQGRKFWGSHLKRKQTNQDPTLTAWEDGFDFREWSVGSIWSFSFWGRLMSQMKSLALNAVHFCCSVQLYFLLFISFWLIKLPRSQQKYSPKL